MDKDQSIESVRGFALLLMVAGHVIGTNGKGMKVDADSLWSYFNFSLSYIRMPLYTVIAGYVYSMRPVQPGCWSGFLGKKVRRLIVPLVFAATIQYLFQSFVPAVNTPREIADIWRIYLFPYTHFWYLQALLTVFALIALIDHYQWFAHVHAWLIGLGAASLFFIFPIPVKFFSLNQVCYLMPFFLLGYGMAKFSDTKFRNKPVTIAWIVVFVAGFTLQQFAWFMDISVHIGSNSLIALVVGMTGASLLVWGRKRIKWLSFIGKYSFSVFLWHVFATAGSRIALGMLLEIRENLGIFFLTGLVFGVSLPIFFEMLIARNRVLAFLCLGKKLRRDPA
jgi:peptidoglycan/LPS O-acetylase OafA/YrhL